MAEENKTRSVLGGLIGGAVSGAISSAVNAASSAISSGAVSKPSGSSGSSGGVSSSGGSGGSSNSNRYYTDNKGNYIDYDSNTDYKALINQAVAKGDLQSAAVYEAYRNAKIANEGLNYEQTNKYSQYLPMANIGWNNGAWGSSGGAAGGSGMSGYMPQDQRDYLNQMYQAQLEAQKEALKQAYESNLSDLQAEQDKLSANYQSARNQTAAQSALSQQRFNETAAAYGLNTGTAGQAALSYSNQLQADISSLQAAESAANAEIERQRTELAKEYQSAMVQAQATNNYELFQALYQEAVRVDQALQQQSQFNSQQAMQQYQMMLDKYNSDRQWQLTQGQWDLTQQQWQYQQQQDQYNKDLQAAELLAAAGDYSAYGKLFGWDQAKIDQMNNAWKTANTVSYSSGGSSGGGSYGGGSSSSGSSGSSSGSGNGYDALFKAAMQSGYPESYINNNYKNFGFTSKTGLYDDYLTWYEKNSSPSSGNQTADMNKVYQYYNNIVDAHEPGLDKGSADYVPIMIMKYNEQGYLNANEVKELFRLFGLNPSDYGA